MKLSPVLKLGGEWLDAKEAAKRGLFLTEGRENGVRRIALENRAGTTVRPEELGWRKAPGRGDFDAPGLKFYVESWQMASPCGVRNWDDEPFDYSPGYLKNCVSTPDDFHPGERGRYLSDNMCCLRRPDGAMRLFGFTTAADRFGHFSVKLDAGGVEEFLALCACDGAELPAGGRIETESLLILDGTDTESLFAAYADRWAADSGARRRFAPPVGWCSWYYYFSKVALSDIVENMDWLAAHRDDPEFGKVRYIQLDDGWQTALGDWRGANDKFPGGLARFADEAKRRGFAPALWVGPFMVESDSAMAAEHPDWLLRDASGAPFSPMGWRGNRVFVLDATRPDVQRHLETLFRDIRALGIDYVKLDFCIIECAVPGAVYHDRTATRAQALRRGFEAIRRGFGDDGFILGCTTPFAPVVGIIDAMRSSTDITPYWSKPGQFAEAPNVPNVCRNVVNHAYMNGRLWINDPDTLIVRDDNTELALPEVELWERAVSLAGGSLLLSDRMSTLSAERLPLVRRALSESGTWSNLRPVDRWERTPPTVWEAERGDGGAVRAVFDFGGAHGVVVREAGR
ncbi:MAG: alpha-galactosidase [Kiritimatiellae bacterium]|nr:alpha-galactosidase [Kiritimatiellia bacterium]